MIDVLVEKTLDGQSVRVTLTWEGAVGTHAMPPSDEFVVEVRRAVKKIVGQ